MGCGASSSRVAARDALIQPSEVVFTDEGTVRDPPALQEAIAASDGLAHELRGRLWLHLLGVVPWSADQQQCTQAIDGKTAEFGALLHRAAEEAGAVSPADRKVIEGDIPRTDRELPEWKELESLEPLRSLLLAHCVHSSWGYFQGMTDIGAVVLSTLGVPHLPAASHQWIAWLACRAPASC